MSVVGPVTLRPLAPGDLPETHALSLAVSWPHRLEDWRLMLDVGHGLAAVDAAGVMQGVALWWPFGTDFATLGLVIVSPVLQRSGIGRRLLAAIMAAAEGRQVQLNATAAGMRLYESFGFVETGGIVQHNGPLGADARPVAADGVAIRVDAPGDRKAIRALDRAASGVDREGLLDALEPVSDTWVAEREGVITGSLLGRAFGRGRLLGPLVASDEATALALLSTAACATGGFLRADIPADAAELARWLAGAGLPAVGHVRTMRTAGPDRSGAGARVFGLASQAWG